MISPIIEFTTTRMPKWDQIDTQCHTCRDEEWYDHEDDRGCIQKAAQKQDQQVYRNKEQDRVNMGF